MWTVANRKHYEGKGKQGKRYPTDLSDEEWAKIAPLMPGAAHTGRPRKVNLREVVNALRYLVRTGCEWRMLPHDFPPHATVYYWFRRFVRRMLLKAIHDVALMLDRSQNAKAMQPSAGIIDSQSVKAPAAQQRGYDANKKITGRKRHVAVDTDGRLLMINLTPADLSDSAGAQMILEALGQRWKWVRHLFGDGAYDKRKLMDKAALLEFTVEVVRKMEGQQRFAPLPKRWVVERTFGWMMRWRQLVRDYERRIDVSQSMIYIAMGSLLLRRIS
jgi:putative transposase